MLLLCLCISAFCLSGASADTDTLHRGESLHAPSQLVARNGHVRLQIQQDGNLVIYQTMRGMNGMELDIHRIF